METKKQFKYFTIFEHEKEQEYLRNMHKNGWKFVKVSGLGTYHFLKCEPEDVVYQLDYNQEGLEHKDEYIKMFNDCGWEHLQEYAGYSYFRKSAAEMNGDEEIFCDESSRLQMMERVLKGRMMPLFVIFTCILVPQFFINLFSFHNYFAAAFLGGIIVTYVIVFAVCAKKYYDFKKRVNK